MITYYWCWDDLDERGSGPTRVCDCGNNKLRDPFETTEGACQ